MRVFGGCVGLWLLACLPAAAEIVDRIAASVNDTAIPESEVRKAMVYSALEPRPGEDREAFRTRVLEAIIEQHLEYEDAARFGPSAPDAAEIDKAISSLRQRIRHEGKDPDAEFAQAGMTFEEVRVSIQRQLVIARYLRERFAPMSFADEEQAREEYEKRYLPGQKAAGRPAEPFESVEEDMRRRYSTRAFDEEVARWLKDLRQRARISIYRVPPAASGARTPVVLVSEPTPARTPGP